MYNVKHLLVVLSFALCAAYLSISAPAHALPSVVLPTVFAPEGFYFVLSAPDGTKVYQRSVKLKVSRLGRLTARKGLPFSIEIYVARGTFRVRVSSRGTVFGLFRAERERIKRTAFGILEVATFPQPDLLSTDDGISFRETMGSGPAMVGFFGAEFEGAVTQKYR